MQQSCSVLSTPHNWKLAGGRGEEERNRKLGPFHGMSVEEDYSIRFYDKILHYVILENANKNLG